LRPTSVNRNSASRPRALDRIFTQKAPGAGR
jgi:hypothetical protein